MKYVGVTDNPQKRYMEHIRPAKRKSVRQPMIFAWVDELSALGLQPLFVFLDSVRSEESEAKEREWIRHFQKISPLLNINHKK